MRKVFRFAGRNKNRNRAIWGSASRSQEARGDHTATTGHYRRVPPCAVKTCAVRPVFTRVAGELRAADPSNQQNASPGEQPEDPRPSGSRGRSRTQDQKTRTVSTCWSNPGGLSLTSVAILEQLKSQARNSNSQLTAFPIRRFCSQGFQQQEFWDIVGHLQGSKGLSLEKSEKKSEKGLPGPLGPGVEKGSKKSRK